MPIPTTTLESQLIEAARQRGTSLLQAFAEAAGKNEPVAVLCARAASMFDDYCDALLASLVSATLPAGHGEHEWVRGHYLPLVSEFGTAMRDAIADPTLRHAAAQTIQCKILEHERQLRLVMDGR